MALPQSKKEGIAYQKSVGVLVQKSESQITNRKSAHSLKRKKPFGMRSLSKTNQSSVVSQPPTIHPLEQAAISRKEQKIVDEAVKEIYHERKFKQNREQILCSYLLECQEEVAGISGIQSRNPEMVQQSSPKETNSQSKNLMK